MKKTKPSSDSEAAKTKNLTDYECITKILSYEFDGSSGRDVWHYCSQPLSSLEQQGVSKKTTNVKDDVWELIEKPHGSLPQKKS